MQNVTELSPAQFRQAYPDTCFACHCRVTGYRHEEEDLVACSASCAAKLKQQGLPARIAPPVPWATDDEEALPT
jgi:hypothetical protein